MEKIKLSNGDEFFVRQITLNKGEVDEYTTLVGGTDLSCLLMHEDGEIPQWEKEELDEQIVFFVEPENLISWSDSELVDYVTKQIN